MGEHRLRPKYTVQRINEAGNTTMVPPTMLSTDPDNVDSPFVLMPRKDPAAFEAMVAYTCMCEPQLANEIRAWLRTIAESEPIYGTQGKRNRMAIRLRRLLDTLQPIA